MTLTTGDKPDFREDTYYGFRRDDGYSFDCEIAEEFAAVIKIEAEHAAFSDQVDQMLLEDAEDWH